MPRLPTTPPSEVFKATQSTLDRRLFQHSAFRYGSSAFRLGLMPRGISDHLPIKATIKHSDHCEFEAISWNLLTDSHLFNSFLNITGATTLITCLEAQSMPDNIYIPHHLHDFFSELSQFLYRQQKGGTIAITQTLLSDFTKLENQSSRLSNSRDLAKIEEKKMQVIHARQQIMDIFIHEMQLTPSEKTQAPSKAGHELRLAIRHALEIIHHIHDDQGVLRWKNRYALLQKNLTLQQSLCHADFLCFQECTNPDDMAAIFKQHSKNKMLLTFRIDEKTQDHCVLAYSSDIFELIGEPINYALEKKKPAIFAKFKHKISGHIFIMASIHHPGGDHHLISELLAQTEKLQDKASRVPFYMLGDYNHTQDFFMAENNPCAMIYPETSTMAGSDYGNTNKAIDALLTLHEKKDDIHVSVLCDQPVAQPAPPVILTFDGAPSASPSFTLKVTPTFHDASSTQTTEFMASSHPKTSAICQL